MNEYENAELYFNEGVKYYQNKDYENAKKFLECLTLRPKKSTSFRKFIKNLY